MPAKKHTRSLLLVAPATPAAPVTSPAGSAPALAIPAAARAPAWGGGRDVVETWHPDLG
jgi:hypothetical protein